MLSLPANFKNDIAGRDTALFPVILIGTRVGSTWTTSRIWISTNQWQDKYGSQQTLPLLLNVPSLKESIDIEKRNYKISSVNIDISNFPYEGVRFSELIGDSSLINTEVRIYWLSPGVDDIIQVDSGYSSYDDAGREGAAFQIYFGTIRRYDMTDEKIRLVVEDRSQSTLHKDLPLANLGGNAVAKYKNKPKPMVYGHVDRSPCVIASAPLLDSGALLEGEIDIIPDIDDSISFVGTYPLYVEKEGSYINIPTAIQEVTFQSGVEYGDVVQYIISGKSILLQSVYEYSSGSESIGSNPISNNEIIGFETLTPSSVNPLRVESGKAIDHSSGQIYYATVSDENFSHFPFTIKGTLFRENLAGDWDQTSKIFDEIGEGTDIWWETSAIHFEETLVGCTMEIPIISESSYKEDTGYIRTKFGVNFYDKVQWTGTFVNIMWRFGGNTLGDYDSKIWNNQSGAGTEASPNWVPDAQPTYNSLDGGDTPIRISNVGQLLFYMQIDAGYAIMAGQTIFEGVEVDHWMLMDNLFNMDFYANVKGRAITPLLFNFFLSPTAPEVIAHILENELGVTGIDETGTYDWYYDFTVDSKISSKKLIEGIASASPYLPRFTNLGDFVFTEIPRDGGTSDFQIKEADCIDFSFSRSKIEDVYTKVVFKYNWDYARGEFNDSVEADLQYVIPLYQYGYYGFTIPTEFDDNENLIHPDSTLIIDDDRGKYIRDHDTAQAFAEWYLLWSCNQKLKLKIKLPLKMMFLEIGDFIDFDAILGGVNPYGIDYIADGEVNGQNVFKNFLIISTNKTLEFCEFEAIQMHDLGLFQFANTIFEAETGYDVIASSELDGVLLENIYTDFPELENLIEIIGIGAVAQNLGTGWQGGLTELAGGAAYKITFSQATMTNLFQLDD